MRWTSSRPQHANGRITLTHEISMACLLEPLATRRYVCRRTHLLELKRASPISVSHTRIPWRHMRQRHHRRRHKVVALYYLHPQISAHSQRCLPMCPSGGTDRRLLSRSNLLVTTNISQAPSQAHVGEPCEEHEFSIMEASDSRSLDHE